MVLEKLSYLEKKEYDELIEEQFLCRVSYQGEKYPQIKPFLYVFDGNYIYILATKYGKKIRYLEKAPLVAVEIETYSKDLSDYKFVTLLGKLTKVKEKKTRREIRRKFVDMIKKRNLSKNVMKALGHSTDEPVEAIAEEERSFVFKLTDVEKITGFKSK